MTNLSLNFLGIRVKSAAKVLEREAMNETQPNQADSDQVIVALEGDAGNLDKLVTVARECGFRKLLSALVKDLQKAQAETIEIIAMAAADELREPDCQRLKAAN